jgi:hypothetical protein
MNKGRVGESRGDMGSGETDRCPLTNSNIYKSMTIDSLPLHTS